MPDGTVSYLKQRQGEVNSDILDILHKFQADTGCWIKEIRTIKMENIAIRKDFIIQIKTEIEI
jgi:hypothetical protein